MNTSNGCKGIAVQKFNPFITYSLGKELFPVLSLEEKDCVYGDVMWVLFSARSTLLSQIKGQTVFQPASKRAAESVVNTINSIVPADLKEMLDKDSNTEIDQYSISAIKGAVRNLETVLTNDMPGVSAYVVSQKGIYKTEDLISHADQVFPSEIRKYIQEQAINDLKEAGKCLAFEVPTACAFHLWRAVETVMGSYYKKLTGKSFEDDNVTPNWAIYIKALNEKGADSNITKFLDHIRGSYRNPQTHPEAMLSVNEAIGLFGVATSAIHQMILEIQKP